MTNNIDQLTNFCFCLQVNSVQQFLKVFKSTHSASYQSSFLYFFFLLKDISDTLKSKKDRGPIRICFLLIQLSHRIRLDKGFYEEGRVFNKGFWRHAETQCKNIYRMCSKSPPDTFNKLARLNTLTAEHLHYLSCTLPVLIHPTEMKKKWG